METSERSPTPRRYLVVANQTVGGDHLVAKIRDCLAAGPCVFHLVVPATTPPDRTFRDEDEANALARQRLSTALDRFRSIGADIDGEIGAASPMDAIHDAITARGVRFDEIILSTLAPGASKWLKLDLPHRVERACSVPVTHLIAPEVQPATPAR